MSQCGTDNWQDNPVDRLIAGTGVPYVVEVKVFYPGHIEQAVPRSLYINQMSVITTITWKYPLSGAVTQQNFSAL